MNWKLIIFSMLFWANTLLFAQNNNYIKVAHAHELEQEALTKKCDSLAFSLFAEAQQIYLENDCWEEYLQSQRYVSVCLYKTRKYDIAIDTLENTFDKIHYSLGKEHELMSGLYNNIAAFSTQKTNYKQAEKYYQKALQLREKYDAKTEKLANTYHNLANFYKQIGDNEQAKRNEKKAIVVYKTLPQLNDSDRIKYAFANLAGIYHTEKKYEKANQLLHIAIKNNSNTNTIIQYYNALADNHIELAEYDSAYSYLQKARKLDTKNKFLNLTYRNIACFYRDKPTPNYQAALDTFQLSLKENINLYGKKNSYIAYANMHIGYTHFLQKNYQKALQHYQKAIHILVPAFKDTTDLYKNPQKLIAEDKINLLKALHRKGKILQAKHSETKAKKDIETALETYQLAAALIDTIRISYFAEESKFSLAEKALPIYENAIEAAIANKNFALAFEFSEKGKAIVLLEATQGRDAENSLPDSLVMQEYETKKNITFYEKKIFVEKNQTENDTAKLQVYEAKLFEAQRKLENLKRLFKSDFPKYHSEKYDIKTVSAKDIQENILQQNVFEQLTQNKKALIAYFVGDSNIYIFTITASDIFIDTAKKTADFEQKVNDFRKVLSDADATNTQKNYEQFYEISTYLYQTLLEKPLLRIPKTKDLIIVPDASLLYLPFAALTKNKPNAFYTENTEYDLSLFVNNYYSISYNYSASLLFSKTKNKTKETHQSNNHFLGFAPVIFTNLKSSFETNKKLDTLKFSRNEILFIDSLFNGMMFLEADANKKRFLQLAENAKIIHISSHAFVSDSLPMQSEIAFADSMMHIYEIYNLPLSAELTVLSACQTAAGKIMRGEGIMSLARGFMYAGCPSVVSSLWSVNDEATTDLMKAFYANLNAGQTKDKALQNAQKTVMQAKNNPYYWAAFVQIGDAKAIEKSNYLLYFSILCFLVILFFLVKRRRKKNDNTANKK